MALPLIDDYRQLFLRDCPLLDARAPVEFAQGAFLNTTNLPLLSDQERHHIGTCYKQHGREAAVALGAERVSGDVKATRLAAWVDYVHAHPQGALYCFRGGMRSEVVQTWIYEQTGIAYPRIKGGYKALRRFLIDETERLLGKLCVVRLGGRTGVGKTRLLAPMQAMVDLEGLANHRGSAFGPMSQPQPTQIQFENELAIALIKLEAKGYKTILLEDEGQYIGSVHLPLVLRHAMEDSPIVVLEQTLEERVALSTQDYVDQSLFDLEISMGRTAALAQLARQLVTNLAKIKRRLGADRYQMLNAELERAINSYQVTKKAAEFYPIVSKLLQTYYDPMYDYQLATKQELVMASGTASTVSAYLAQEFEIR